MKVVIPYDPHPGQIEVHNDPTRFKTIAAGRRWGKTVTLVNEHIRQALLHPSLPGQAVQRSWYVCTTYRQADMIAWKTTLRFLPQELIESKNVNKLQIVLVNGHVMEFKGTEDPDNLRGAGLVWCGVDEYGLMKAEVWHEVLRPMLIDTKGGAMFIGTPGPDGSPHFHDLYLLGNGSDPAFKSWLFFTTTNPHIPPEEIAEAKRNLPDDIYKREFEADFDITAGLIYDNFRHVIHVIPHYVPNSDDFIVGAIDPGMHNPTAAILTAWDREGVGRVFAEYYKTDKLASENALAIRDLALKAAPDMKVAYWVIDRSSSRRDMTNGVTVFDKYQEVLKPLLPAKADPGSVWAGIDEMKKMLHVDPIIHRPRLYVTAQCQKWLWEISRYIRYKHKWNVDKNEEEKPRKKDDHLMDCTRNVIYSRPWLRRHVRILYQPKVAYA